VVLEQIEADANRVMPPSLRPARVAELEAELEQLAYVEEAPVVQALERGESVERRSSARPEAILQVRIATAKPATPPVEKLRQRAVA
jgi:hypothetical protein